MARGYDDERERPSWREIDKRRDRSSPYGRDNRDRDRAPRSNYDKEDMKRRAEEFLFSKGKGTGGNSEERQMLAEKQWTPEFDKTVASLVSRSGFPDDWTLLFMMMDVKDDTMLKQVAESMKEKYPERSQAEKQSFMSKLRILSISSRNMETKELLQEIAADLED